MMVDVHEAGDQQLAASVDLSVGSGVRTRLSAERCDTPAHDAQPPVDDRRLVSHGARVNHRGMANQQGRYAGWRGRVHGAGGEAAQRSAGSTRSPSSWMLRIT